MKKVVFFLTLFALASSSCGPTSNEQLSTALSETRSAESIHCTDTARVPPTDTPTPLPPTPTPTSSPTPNIEATISYLSAITLVSSDLPDSFQPISFEELGFSDDMFRNLWREYDISVGNSFAFLYDAKYQFIMGWTIFVPDRLTRAAFLAELSRPDTLLESWVDSFPQDEISDQGILPKTGDIGDASAGFTIGLNFGEDAFPARIDTIIFMEGSQGALILEMYIDDNEPTIPIGNVAKIIQEKMANAQH